MKAFDNLPSLGFVHRPVFVKFEDEDGHPVTRRDARQKLREAVWQQALQTLPDAERAKGPARIVAAFDNKSSTWLRWKTCCTSMRRRAGRNRQRQDGAVHQY